MVLVGFRARIPIPKFTRGEIFACEELKIPRLQSLYSALKRCEGLEAGYVFLVNKLKNYRNANLKVCTRGPTCLFLHKPLRYRFFILRARMYNAIKPLPIYRHTYVCMYTRERDSVISTSTRYACKYYLSCSEIHGIQVERLKFRLLVL